MKKRIALLIIIIIFMTNNTIFATDNLYLIQAGFYQDRKIAEQNYTALKAKGYPIYKHIIGNGTRLYVGRYSDRQYAEKISKELQDLGYETLIHTEKPQPKAKTALAEVPKQVKV